MDAYKIKIEGFDSSEVEKWVEESAEWVCGICLAQGCNPRYLADEAADEYYDREHAFAIFAAYGWQEIMDGGADPWEWFKNEIVERARAMLAEKREKAHWEELDELAPWLLHKED